MKVHPHTRRTPRSALACGLVAIVVSLAVVLAGCRPEEVESAPFIAGEDAIARAAAYLVASEAVLGSDAVYPIEYLRRRYGAEWAKGAADRLAEQSRLPENRERLYPFLRLLDPSATYQFDPAAPPPAFAIAPTSWNLVLALHCRDVPLLPSFLTSLDEQSRSWDRGAAISARALGWAAEQGCINETGVKATDEVLRARMLAYIRATPGIDIGFVESVAMLLYLGHRDDIEAAWIDRIESGQSADGSWTLEGNQAVDRSTAESLLGIAQYANPGTPPIPWVPPRPAKAIALGHLPT